MRRCVRVGIIMALVLMAGCESNNKAEQAYRNALDLIKEHSYPQAVGVLAELGNYKDSIRLRSQLYDMMNGATIAIDGLHIAAIKSDGTIEEHHASENATGTKGWHGVKHILAGDGYLTGIDETGSVVTTDPVTIAELEASPLVSAGAMIQVIMATHEWKRAVAYEGHYPQSAVALFEDGTVSVASSLLTTEEVNSVSSWQQIVTIAESRSYIAGVKEDGTVVIAGGDDLIYEMKKALEEARQWTNIASISAGDGNIVGLKRDGTVVAAGINKFGERNVEDWKDIVAVSADSYHTVGLTRDGTVVFTGDRSHGETDVGGWRDIVEIDASANYTLGLKRDGTLVIAGNPEMDNNQAGEVPDVSEFTGLLVPSVQ